MIGSEFARSPSLDRPCIAGGHYALGYFRSGIAYILCPNVECKYYARDFYARDMVPIGDLRRTLFTTNDSAWNGWVRDITAMHETTGGEVSVDIINAEIVRFAQMSSAATEMINTFEPSGARLVVDERHRQINVEGYTLSDDDRYNKRADLTRAAMAYLEYVRMIELGSCHELAEERAAGYWPWGLSTFKTKGDILRCLVKAGALICAEIDRILRGK